MLGTSLTRDGAEYLAPAGRPRRLRAGPHDRPAAAGPVGQPARRRRVQGRHARPSTSPTRPRIHRDANGLPIHGTLTARPGLGARAGGHRPPRGGAGRAARRRRPARPARVLPLPPRADGRVPARPRRADRRHHRAGHRSPAGARVVRLAPLPAAARASAARAVRLVLPARRHLELDERGIPTGDGATSARPRPIRWAAARSTTSTPSAATAASPSKAAAVLRLLLDRTTATPRCTPRPTRTSCASSRWPPRSTPSSAGLAVRVARPGFTARFSSPWARRVLRRA